MTKEESKKSFSRYFVHLAVGDVSRLTETGLQLIVKEIFDPRYGMFLYDENMHHFW